MLDKFIVILMAGAITLSQFVPSPSQMMSLFEDGQKLFVIEDYPSAIKKYEKILSIDSPLLKEEMVTTSLADMELSIPLAARYQMANSYKNLDKYDAAVDNFRLVERESNVRKLAAMAQYQIVLSRYNQGDYEACVKESEYLLEKYGDSEYAERALYNIGWSHFKLEQYEQAISAFKQKNEQFPEGEYSPRAQFQIGESYFELEKFDDAIESFQLLIDNYVPKSFSERQWSEMELSRLRRRTQVESGIGQGRSEQHIIELSAKAFIRIGDAYRRLDQPEQSIQSYQRIPQDYLPMSDLVETAYIKMAEVTFESKGLDEAINVYKSAIDQTKDRTFRAKMQFQIAKLNFENERYEQSVDEYKLYISGYRDVSEQVDFTVDETYYQIALAYFEANDYDSSLVYYQAVIDSFPGSHLYTSSVYGKGLSYQKSGDFDRAIEVMNQLIENYPNDDQTPLAFLQIARIYYDRENYDKAIEAYLSVKERFSTNKNIDINTIYFELALCYRDKGQTDLAIENFKKIDKESELFPGAYSEISEIFLENGSFDEAEASLKQVLNILTDPKRKAEIHYYLARIYISSQQYDNAMTHFNLAIENVEKPEILQSSLFGRGVIYFQLKHYDLAVNDFENLLTQPRVIPELKSKAQQRLVTCYLKMGNEQQAIDTAQDFVATAKSKTERAEGLLALAQVYYQTNQYQDGINVTDQIFELSEDENIRAQAYFVKGNCFLGLRSFEQAKVVFNTAIQEYPNSDYVPDIFFQLGITYYNSEDFVNAAETFRKVTEQVKFGDNRLFSFYYRGYCLFRLGRWSEARESFEKITAEFPNREEAAEAAFQIAECYFNERQYEKAIEAYREVQKKYPKSHYAAQAMYNSGWGYIQGGQEEEGIAIFEDLAKTYPDSVYAVDALFTIGDWHYNNKRYEQAEQVYQTLLERYPESELAEKAKTHIHELSQISSYLEYQKASELFDEKKYKEAIEAFQSVIEKYPDADIVVGARVNTAASYEQLKNWRKALQEYEKIMNDYKDKKGADYQNAYTFAKEHYEWIKENY